VWWESDNARGPRPHEGGFAKKTPSLTMQFKLSRESVKGKCGLFITCSKQAQHITTDTLQVNVLYMSFI